MIYVFDTMTSLYNTGIFYKSHYSLVVKYSQHPQLQVHLPLFILPHCQRQSRPARTKSAHRPCPETCLLFSPSHLMLPCLDPADCLCVLPPPWVGRRVVMQMGNRIEGSYFTEALTGMGVACHPYQILPFFNLLVE